MTHRTVVGRYALSFVLLTLLVTAHAQTAEGSRPASLNLPPGVDLQRPVALQDAVAIALLNSPSLPVAQQQALQADASLVQARATAAPAVGLSADAAVTKSVVGGGADDTRTSRELQVVVSHDFFSSGRSERIRAARLTADAARLGVTDTRRLLVLAVAQDYYAALAARSYVDVARRSAALARQHLAMTDARFEQGMAARADRYTFETELAQAQVQVISAENQAETTLNSLKLTLGMPADMALLLAEDSPRLTLPGKTPEAVEQALAARPDVQALRSELEAARQRTRIAHLNRGPVLSAGGDAGYGYFTGETGAFWQLQVGAELPLFDAGSTRAAEDSARAAEAIAAENLRLTELEARNQIETYHRSAVYAAARLEAADVAVKSAENSLRAAQAKYASDMAKPLDVTDAEVNLRSAEADYVQAVYDYNTAAAALLAALGQDIVPQTAPR